MLTFWFEFVISWIKVITINYNILVPIMTKHESSCYAIILKYITLYTSNGYIDLLFGEIKQKNFNLQKYFYYFIMVILIKKTW